MNKQCVKEWMAFGFPFSGDIKHDGSLFFKDYSFNYDGSSIHDAIVRIDRLLTDILLGVRDKYPSDTVFGLGLSGGLDSRVLLYYMLKVGMKVQTFIWGTARPHKVILSRDHYNSVLISRKLGIPKPVFVPYTLLPDIDQFMSDCKQFPFSIYSFNYHVDWGSMPHVDVILHGLSGGEIFGSCLPSDVCKDFTHHLIHRISLLSGTQHRSIQKSIPGILSQNEYHFMYDKIKDFLDRYDDPVCGIQSFMYNYCLLMNKRHGGIHPFEDKRFIDLSLTWDPGWLNGRYIYKVFYRSVFPFLGYIPGQRYSPPLLSGNKLVDRVWYLGEYVLRWNGMPYHHILRSLRFHGFGDSILHRSNPGFYGFFDIECVKDLPRYFGVLYAQLVRMKYIFDNGWI